MSGTYTTDEKIEYALKTALFRTMQTKDQPASDELAAPPRIFPKNIMKVNLIEKGNGDIDEDGYYVGRTTSSSAYYQDNNLVNLEEPELTVRNYRIIDPTSNKISDKRVGDMTTTNVSQTDHSTIGNLPTSGTTYPMKNWFFRGHYGSHSGTTAYDAANSGYDGLQLAWDKSTVGATATEEDIVPHLKFYLQVQTKEQENASGDNITFANPLMKGLIGLDQNFTSTLKVVQGEGGNCVTLSTTGSSLGGFWFTQPTSGTLSFYGVHSDVVNASDGLSNLLTTKFPMISFIRYTGETGFGAGSGGGGSATVLTSADSNVSNMISGTAETMPTQTFEFDGNIGIGTTSPYVPLHASCGSFASSGENNPQVYNTTAYANVAAAFTRTNSDGGNTYGLFIGNLANTGASYLQNLSINNNNYYNLLLQPNGGNVGIGTTDPKGKLHIHGGGLHVFSNAVTGSGDAQMASNAGDANIFMDVNNHPSSTAKNGIIWKTKYQNNAGYTKTSAGIYFQPEGNFFRGGLAFYTNGTANETTNASERLRIDMDGNVGIGTTTPGGKLDINNDTGTAGPLHLYQHNAESYGANDTAAPSNSSYWNYNPKGTVLNMASHNANQSQTNATLIAMTAYGTGGATGVYLGNVASSISNGSGNLVFGRRTGAHSFAETMRINKDGNVGIGTTNPAQKLHVNGHLTIGAHDSQPTDTTVLTNPDGKQNAIIFYNRYYTWAGGSNIQAANGARTWHNFISSKYHSTDPYSGSAGYHAFLLWTYYGHSGTADVAMRMGSGNGNSKIWVNGSTTISSDRRIKTNITDVPDDLALEIVRKIPCRYYEYKRDIYNEYDYQREKPNRTIGFIAQEVKEICPEAVDITEYKIPLDNKIYRDLDIDNSKNFIIIKDYSNNDLSANDEVECVINPMNNNNITQDNYKEYIDISDNQTINIKYISGCNFEILDNIDNLVFEEILLKNKKVDDFHTLDKQKLFALNFSATQEIDRQQQSDKTKIAELENEVATLKSELVAIKQHLGI